MVTVFAVCAIVGIVTLVAAFLLGEIDVGGVHGGDLGLPWLSAPAIAAAVGVFGVVGWPLAVGTDANAGVIVAVAAGGAVLAYALLLVVLRAMRQSQTGTVAGLRSAVGTIGEVSMAIPAAGWGQVTYRDSESTRVTTTAILVDHGAVAAGGAQVLIVDVDGDRLVVEPLHTQP